MAPKKEKVESVSRDEFNSLSSSVNDLVGLVKQALEKPATPTTPEEIKAEKEVEKASTNKISTNDEWEEIAREIIGDAVDHTEVAYLKGGGLNFTVVIKNDKSNAPLDYLERYKQDRRSKEVGAEGEAGVRNWCVLIKNNLKRERPISN
jgi:hypothetical protein